MDGKSTAIHAKIIAEDDVDIYTYPNIPEYKQPERTLLLFPGPVRMYIEYLKGQFFLMQFVIGRKTIIRYSSRII